MNRRGLLRSQLKQAWRIAIDERYKEQLINSERGLQFYFCEALLRLFDKDGVTHIRRLFIEPHLKISRAASHKYPDVVICNTSRIIGIVEIKYAPRARPYAGLKKDLETLSFAARNSKHLIISNDRYLGDASIPKLYQLAEDAVLCWAGIYRGNQLDMCSLIKNEDKQILPYFLQLDALTHEGDSPRVIIS